MSSWTVRGWPSRESLPPRETRREQNKTEKERSGALPSRDSLRKLLGELLAPVVLDPPTRRPRPGLQTPARGRRCLPGARREAAAAGIQAGEGGTGSRPAPSRRPSPSAPAPLTVNPPAPALPLRRARAERRRQPTPGTARCPPKSALALACSLPPPARGLLRSSGGASRPAARSLARPPAAHCRCLTVSAQLRAAGGGAAAEEGAGQ